MSALKGKLKRQIRVYGINSPVNIIFTENGLSVALPGFKTYLQASWDAVVSKAMSTPSNCPASLDGRCMDFLRDQERKLNKKQEAKLRQSSD